MKRLVRFTGLKLIIAGVVTVCSMGLASQVSAVTILDTSSSLYLGSISPDGGSPSTEADQINVLIGLTLSTTFDDGTNFYDRSSNSCGTCPTATAVGSVGDDSGAITGNFGSGFTYLKAKYDNTQAGAYIWYVAGLTGDFEVPSFLGDCGHGNGCGLSHWILFNPSANVSEPSTTLLLGLAFAGVAFFGKKFLART